jgi:hypothetical protein
MRHNLLPDDPPANPDNPPAKKKLTLLDHADTWLAESV